MINIAIEGQLLLGAFTAAVVASAVGVLWLGLISGSLAGGLVGAGAGRCSRSGSWSTRSSSAWC